jgi:flagellar motor protein MotB
MVVEGFGESQLLLPFEPEAAENRRVEVSIIDRPTGQMQ